jgi:hypothetical protein
VALAWTSPRGGSQLVGVGAVGAAKPGRRTRSRGWVPLAPPFRARARAREVEFGDSGAAPGTGPGGRAYLEGEGRHELVKRVGVARCAAIAHGISSWLCAEALVRPQSYR